MSYCSNRPSETKRYSFTVQSMIIRCEWCRFHVKELSSLPLETTPHLHLAHAFSFPRVLGQRRIAVFRWKAPTDVRVQVSIVSYLESRPVYGLLGASANAPAAASPLSTFACLFTTRFTSTALRNLCLCSSSTHHSNVRDFSKDSLSKS